MRTEELLSLVLTTKDKLDSLSRSVNERFDYQYSEMQRLESNVEEAVTTVIHELIDYIRHDDIEAIDEAEFASKLKLLLQKEPELPF